MHILAISGSLRAMSSNTTLLRAAVLLAPSDSPIVLYEGLGDLPHFNPDLDIDDVHPAVNQFRLQLRQAGAVLISSPEYAHGVPGVIKNALDWVVGSGELMAKPVGLINASPRSTFAVAQLSETLTVMSARVIAGASITLPLRKIMDEHEIIADEQLAALVQGAVAALRDAVT